LLRVYLGHCRRQASTRRTTYGLGSLGRREGLISDPLGHRQSIAAALLLTRYSVGLSRFGWNIFSQRAIVERQVSAHREAIVGFGTGVDFVAMPRMGADILRLKSRGASRLDRDNLSSSRRHSLGFLLGRAVAEPNTIRLATHITDAVPTRDMRFAPAPPRTNYRACGQAGASSLPHGAVKLGRKS
jgi:hypothetical protein